MRRYLIVLLLLWATTAQARSAKYAILDYNSSPSCSSAAVLAWINSNFDFKVNGCNPNSSIRWSGYYDILGPQSVAEWLNLKDWATANGVNAEDTLLHASANYTTTVYNPWQYNDKFDNFEGAKGVMRTADDITYTDLTATAYSGNVTWQNTVYVGYEEPFDQINLVLSTAGVGITRAWEYWNGSTWAALTVTDGTTSFASSGQVAFTPPSSWARKVVNGSRNKYFVRCRITAASTNPVTSSVKGDPWWTSTVKGIRGWSYTDANRVNVGTELEYNPSPPTGSLAKFRYQSRVPYYAPGVNRYVANPTNYQTIGGSSKRAWSSFLAFRINQLATANGWSDIMGDDGGSLDSFNGTTSANTDFSSANGWTVENVNKYADTAAELQSMGSTAKVGINGQTKALVNAGHWNLAEYFQVENSTTGSARAIPVTDCGSSTTCYDDYLSNGKTGLLIYSDTRTTAAAAPAVAWDRANRGPMVALSKHLIAANSNTYFSYYTQGGFIYSDTDHVHMLDGSTVRLATQAAPSYTLVDHWGTWFPAMAVDFGTPDAGGWNGGARSFAWKSHTEIGGVQDIWRRDYTNAVILHRPAIYNTTASEYQTYSSSIDLGGTYYPLYADGTSGAAVTTVALRTGEGAILMKAPIGETPLTTHRSLIGRCAARIR